MKHRIYLASKFARERAKAWIDKAPEGWLVEFREKNRTDLQNDKLHAMIEDLRAQVPGGDAYSKEDWKLRLMQGLRNETRFLPELEGPGMFPVGQKTSTLSVTQFAALVELTYAYGGKFDVQWTDPRDQQEAA